MDTCGHVGLSALVSDNGCNSETTWQPREWTWMVGAGGAERIRQNRVVTVHDAALWEESQKHLRRRCRWPCPSSWREESVLCWPQLRALWGARDTGLTHTHTGPVLSRLSISQSHACLSKMQILGPHFKPTASEALGSRAEKSII